MKNKYVIIGAIIGGLLGVMDFYFLSNVPSSENDVFIIFPFFPAVLSLYGFYGTEGNPGFGGYLIFMIYGAIVCSLIGWIYGKIKNRNQTKIRG